MDWTSPGARRELPPDTRRMEDAPQAQPGATRKRRWAIVAILFTLFALASLFRPDPAASAADRWRVRSSSSFDDALDDRQGNASPLGRVMVMGDGSASTKDEALVGHGSPSSTGAPPANGGGINDAGEEGEQTYDRFHDVPSSKIAATSSIRQPSAPSDGNPINKTEEEFRRKQVFYRYNNYHSLNKTEKGKVDVPVPLPWSLPNAPADSKSSREFMDELNDLKRNNGVPLPWEALTDGPFKLPTPIFVLNFPKSGTTTLDKYFGCGNLSHTHTYTRYTYDHGPEGETIRIGSCLRNNMLADNATTFGRVAPLDRCDGRDTGSKIKNYRAFSDIGVAQGMCFYPTVHDGGMHHLAKYYPNATILLMVRDAGDWYRSMQNWSGGRILKKWVRTCKFGNRTDDEGYWTDFYRAHSEKIRRFAQSHISMTYIEVEMNNTTGSALEQYTGIPSKCFMHCAPHRACNSTAR